MVAVINTLIVVCIAACHKSERLNNRINLVWKSQEILQATASHYLLHSQREVHSATELTLNMESQTNGEMSQETEQKVAGGVKRESTISQQNEAYGIHGGVKCSTMTQQNEAYGLTKTEAPVLAFITKQPDTGQESDEYSYVLFQTR